MKGKAQKDRELNEALKQTFPASDPLSSNEADDEPVRPRNRKPALFDPTLVHRLAERVGEQMKKRMGRKRNT